MKVPCLGSTVNIHEHRLGKLSSIIVGIHGPRMGTGSYFLVVEVANWNMIMFNRYKNHLKRAIIDSIDGPFWIVMLNNRRANAHDTRLCPISS